MLKSIHRALIPLGLLLAFGCAEEAPPEATNATTADAAPAADPTPTPDPEPEPQTAEAAVQAVIDGVGAGNAGAVWDAMPSGYQSDINDLVQTFGSNMDPALWNQVRGAVEKVHTVLDSKAEFLMNSSALPPSDDPEQLKQSLPQIAGMLKTVLDMSDLDKLKTFDGQQFFQGPASNLIKQADAIASLAPEGFSMTSSMQNMTVTTVSSSGDTATLKFSNPDDPSQDREEEFQRVDDHWVPANMAQDWDQQMESARAQLAAMPAALQEQAFMINAIAASISGGLDPLIAAEDQEQFDLAITNLQAGLGPMMGPMFGGMGPPMGGPGGADASPDAAPEFSPEEPTETPEPAEEPAAAE